MSELVKIDGEEFSVVDKPPKNCQAVVDVRDKMMRTIDLKSFLGHLRTVGKYIRIAYNGVAGDTELQITMREIGFEVAELCDQSGLTISKFCITADSILTDLTGAYQFFLDELEDMAITSLESVSAAAAEMAKETEKLAMRFEQEEKRVAEAWKETARKKGLKESEIKELEEKEKKMRAEADKQEKVQKLATEEQSKLEKEIEETTAQNEKLSEKLAVNATDVVLGVMSAGIVPIYRLSKASKAIQSNHERIERLHKLKKDEIERRQIALKEIAESVKQIAQCSDKRLDITDHAITALHGAVGALNRLRIILQQATTFWKTMQQECENQSKGKLQQLVDKASKLEDPQKRLKAYQNSAMKKRAVDMYISWTAMETICEDYSKTVKGTREELYQYLGENPTVEESKKRIGMLCEEFHQEIAEADKELAKLKNNLQ